MKALSLFSGIGGLDLAAEMAGIETAAFCEIEPFPVEVLKKRFLDVPIFSDVRKLKRGDINGSIEIIHGGFPCQDLSQAGKQAGLEGARSGLWFEMLRVISEFRPRYVLAENVRGAVNLALDTVYSGLVGEGYKVYTYVIPASAVGAPHQRERLFVVGVREDVQRRYTEAMANPGCELRQGTEFSGANGVETGNRDADKPERSGGTLWPSLVASDGSCGGIISPDDTYVQKASGLFRKINRKGTDGSVGLARIVKLWPTPVKEDYRRRGPNSRQQGLPEIVHKLWPTPNVSDKYYGHQHDEGRSYLRWEALKLWPTPTTDSATDRSAKYAQGGTPLTFTDADGTVKLWPTPSANEDACGTPNGKMQKMLGNNPEVRKTSGQLNPDWAEQLMGYPEGWTDLDVDEPRERQGWPALLGQEQYPFEFPRTTTGCKNRAKRLKALGNSVVPAQAYPFFRTIAEIEKVVKEVIK